MFPRSSDRAICLNAIRPLVERPFLFVASRRSEWLLLLFITA
nr:MAG TPA: hypothetical protein [Caudoviricetes sp.]